MKNLLDESVGPIILYTVIKMSIHEDNSGGLIMVETLTPQFTPWIKNCSSETIWFHEEIHKRGVKLNNIRTMKQLGYIFNKFIPRSLFEYLCKKLMGCYMYRWI